jgi:hypothetical protein
MDLFLDLGPECGIAAMGASIKSDLRRAAIDLDFPNR